MAKEPVSTSLLDIMVLRNFYFCVKQFEILLVFQFKFKTLPLSLLNCCENEWVLWISNSKMYLLAFLINNYGVWLFQRVKSCLRSVSVELKWHWPMLKDSEVSKFLKKLRFVTNLKCTWYRKARDWAKWASNLAKSDLTDQYDDMRNIAI